MSHMSGTTNRALLPSYPSCARNPHDKRTRSVTATYFPLACPEPFGPKGTKFPIVASNCNDKSLRSRRCL